MKKYRFYSCLMVMTLILFHLAGCGKGDDEAKDVSRQVVPEAATPQAVPEPAGPPPIPEVTETTPAVLEIIDVIMIENKVYADDRKGPVKFSHLKHSREYGASCVECHHLYQDGKNIWKEGDHVNKCVVCHDPVEEKEKAVRLQSAFHNNCRDCHTRASQEGKNAPYKKCSECHAERG